MAEPRAVGPRPTRMQVAGCAIRSERPVSSDHSPTPPVSSSQPCSNDHDAVLVFLGGQNTGPLAGNPDPVPVQLSVGQHLTVQAHFAERHLSAPHASNGLQLQACPSPGPTSPSAGDVVFGHFTARRSGHTTVTAATDDCGPCAGLVFTADVIIRP